MLKIGQKLWWVNWETKTEGTVIVANLDRKEFSVWYNGKLYKREYSVLGKTLFYKSQLQKPKPKPQKQTPYATPKSQKRIPYYTPKPAAAQSAPPVYSPPVYSKPPAPQPKSCANCFLRFSGECTSLREELCEDYRARQTIPQEEIDAWPEFGDVTTFRLRKYKELKKKEKF